jgi:hypothetical protein
LKEDGRHEDIGSWFASADVEEIKTHISCSITSFIENRAVYEIMCGKILYSRAGGR